MKKLITVAGTALLAVAVYGQGTVNFINSAGTSVTNSLTGQKVVAGTTFVAALYYIPDQASAPTTADFTASGIQLGGATSFAGAGIYNGGVRSAPTSGGGAGWFQVRAWESAFGATYNEAVANATPQGGRLALVGTSNIIKVTMGNPNPPATPPGGLTTSGLQWFFLTPVPEPSVIGLGILGIGALLLLRRRK